MNAITSLDYKAKISSDPKVIKAADVLVLPGVGAFDRVMDNLRGANLENVLNEEVLEKKKPILGICAGMQMMATSSEENGYHQGLNWIKGKVRKLDPPKEYVVPHVGWNDIVIKTKDTMFSRLSGECHFYFDHSFHFVPDNSEHIAAVVDYGTSITAAVQYGHICGVQFHPEKSQTNGLKLFRSFFTNMLNYA
jgi:glutamine amidotransferase